MPVVAIPLDELFGYLGRELPADQLEHELHRFGCSVEGWSSARRWRCPACGALSDSGEGEELPPPLCEVCGTDLRAGHAEAAGDVRVLRMELLAVRPDLFDPAGLARGLAGFLGFAAGAPKYRLETGSFFVDVDPALAGPDVHRPRIVAATLHGLALDEARLRSLMKLQENVHWALGRDRKLASIGVYDLATVAGPGLTYRAVAKHGGARFVPLGYDPRDPAAALDPAGILAQHPKGKSFAWLLERGSKVPLLADGAGQVLSMPPIINSEATRVTTRTTDVVVDVTGLEDRHIDRALNMIVTSLLEACPGAVARTVEVRYGKDSRTTPDFRPQEVLMDAHEAGRLIGERWTPGEVVALLQRMRHDARVEGDKVRVFVPAWRSDILHPRDLAEDVAIAHGYDRLPEAPLTSATYGGAHPREELAARARAVLVGQGFLEVMTLALSSENATYRNAGVPDENLAVVLEYPVSQEQTMVRVSLVPGLMETLAVNLGHPYPQRIAEVGLVAFADAAAPTAARESLVASFALAGDGEGYASVRAAVDAFAAELDLAAAAPLAFRPSAAPLFLPGRGADLYAGERRIGRLGEVHPAVLERFRIIHPVALAEIEIG